ncbi:MAG TPA: hypothetical protein VLA56_14180 [Pseudomonadales bacterium]|nr:hypothetical protein [Pseudomonadales bacterium]
MNGMRILALPVLLALASTAPAADLSLWRALDWFEGTWRGEERASLGEGAGQRCTTDLFGGRFQFSWSRTEIAAGSRHMGGTWERWQIVSRDPDTGLIVLEQFDSSGYRSRFELDAAQSSADRFSFVATELGGESGERQGRLTLAIRRGDRFDETLELGDRDGPLNLVSVHRWRRTEGDPAICVGQAPSIGPEFRASP